MARNLDRVSEKERKLQDIEEKATENEQLFLLTAEGLRLVAEAAKVHVYDFNMESNAITLIRGLEELLGYKPEEVSFNHDWWMNQIHPDDRDAFKDKLNKAIETGTDTLFEYRIRRKQGYYIVVHDTAKMVKNDSGKVVRIVGGVRDVTERKKAENALRKSEWVARHRAEELEKLQVKLEEKTVEVEEYATRMEELAEERARKLQDAERLAAIGATAGMVGHDIRNPLQAILGDLYLIASELASLPEGEEKESIKESVNSINECVDYIDEIVQNLQDYAKPLKPIVRETDFEELCEDVLFEKGWRENVAVSFKVEREARTLVADPILLRRILANLVNNAVQAMPEGGKLDVHAYREAGEVFITVHDTGVGVPAELKDKLFTPLFTTKAKGQGFGLPVVKRMTEALGGTVTFESEEGKGTKFIVRLPATKKVDA